MWPPLLPNEGDILNWQGDRGPDTSADMPVHVMCAGGLLIHSLRICLVILDASASLFGQILCLLKVAVNPKPQTFIMA